MTETDDIGVLDMSGTDTYTEDTISRIFSEELERRMDNAMARTLTAAGIVEVESFQKPESNDRDGTLLCVARLQGELLTAVQVTVKAGSLTFETMTVRETAALLESYVKTQH